MRRKARMMVGRVIVVTRVVMSMDGRPAQVVRRWVRGFMVVVEKLVVFESPSGVDSGSREDELASQRC